MIPWAGHTAEPLRKGTRAQLPRVQVCSGDDMSWPSVLASDAPGGRVARGLAPGERSAFPERSHSYSLQKVTCLQYTVHSFFHAFIHHSSNQFAEAYCMPELCWGLEMLL